MAWERRCRREGESLREQIRVLEEQRDEDHRYEERGRRRSHKNHNHHHKRSRSCHHYYDETGEETTEVEDSRSCCGHSKQQHRSRSRKSEGTRMIKTTLTPTGIAGSTLNAFTDQTHIRAVFEEKAILER